MQEKCGPKAQEQAGEQPSTSASPGTLPTRVLIVDDEPVLARMMTRAFERTGYRVETVETGEDAMAALLRFDPAVAVLDVRLSGSMQGPDICRHIRVGLHRADIVIVFVTASSQEGDARLGIALGGDAYLRKPISPQLLVETVSDLLAERAGKTATIA